jgi:hypothetical protein
MGLLILISLGLTRLNCLVFGCSKIRICVVFFSLVMICRVGLSLGQILYPSSVFAWVLFCSLKGARLWVGLFVEHTRNELIK